MKKFTALMLVVLMVVSFVPFGAFAATEWTEVKTAEDFAKMTDGNYWLTADIDLSKAAWTTIAEFSGTLNGNGKTVTVPADAPIFDKLTGTVKNVNLKGTMTLVAADASALYIPGDINGYAVGVLANNAIGATIDNVHANVDVNFKNDKPTKSETDLAPADGRGANFGLIGFATADFTTTKDAEGKVNFTLNEKTVINNVTAAGTWTLEFVNTHNRNNTGTIVGAAMGGVEITKCVASAKVSCSNTKGNKGGIIGHVNDVFASALYGGDNINYESKNTNTYVTECLFAGSWDLSGALGERYGGIVGYARGLRISKCAVTGTQTGGGSIFGVWGYANANGADVHNEVADTIFVGQLKTDVLGAGTLTIINIKKTNADATLVANNIYRVGTDKLHAQDEKAEGKPQIYTTKDFADKAAAIAAFAADNNAFEVKDGALVLKATAFTPEADPFTPPTPVLKDGATLEVAGDIKLTAYDQQALRGEAKAEYVNTNGVDNSASIKVTRTYGGSTNQAGHLELHMDIASAGKLGENKYLVVWADLTNVDFRKACFGLVDENGNIYRTDDDDGTYPEFYYLADGAAEWETLKHGKDGCFGFGDDGSQSVKGKKGYFAFPVEDFQKGKTALSADFVVDGVYFFLTYPEDKVNTVVAEPFYLDDFQLVEDYKTVNAEPDTPDTPAPTGDMTIVMVAVALVSLAAVTVIAKKKVTE